MYKKFPAIKKQLWDKLEVLEFITELEGCLLLSTNCHGHRFLLECCLRVEQKLEPQQVFGKPAGIECPFQVVSSVGPAR